LWLLAFGVGQRAVRIATSPRYKGTVFWPALRFLNAAHFAIVSSLRTLSTAHGVGHKPEAISSMGRIDGTSRDNGRPAGVTDAFQVSTHSVEPILSNRCRNLFSHEDRGPTGADKLKEDGPEVALVFLRFAFPGNGEGLAGGAACPQRPFVRPASETGGVAPSADPSEEVALGKTSEVVRLNIDN
jgi:hypothetical protein